MKLSSSAQGPLEALARVAASEKCAVGVRRTGVPMASKSKSKNKSKSGGFQSMGLSKTVFRGVMRLGYKVPTPIQRAVLPVALSGRDLIKVRLDLGEHLAGRGEEQVGRHGAVDVAQQRLGG